MCPAQTLGMIAVNLSYSFALDYKCMSLLCATSLQVWLETCSLPDWRGGEISGMLSQAERP